MPPTPGAVQFLGFTGSEIPGGALFPRAQNPPPPLFAKTHSDTERKTCPDTPHRGGGGNPTIRNRLKNLKKFWPAFQKARLTHSKFPGRGSRGIKWTGCDPGVIPWGPNPPTHSQKPPHIYAWVSPAMFYQLLGGRGVFTSTLPVCHFFFGEPGSQYTQGEGSVTLDSAQVM